MSFRVTKISGIEVRLHYTWFIIFVLMAWSLATGYLPSEYPGQMRDFYWIIGIASALTLFCSVLVHEFLHSLVARRYGIEARNITLYFLGGVSEISDEAHSPDVELKISAAGPLASLLLSAFFYLLWSLFRTSLPLGFVALFHYSYYINLILSAFNLVPAFPLDGGRILRAFLWKRRNEVLSSTRAAVRLSKSIGYGLITYGLLSIILFPGLDGLWILILGYFINTSADASLSETRVTLALSGVKVEDIMSKEVATVEPDLTIQQLIDYKFRVLKHRGFPVVKDNEVLGLITEDDIRKTPFERWDELRVKDIMTPADKLITTKPGDSAMDSLIMMAKAKVGRLPVMMDGKLVGIVTRSDFAKAIFERLKFRS